MVAAAEGRQGTAGSYREAIREYGAGRLDGGAVPGLSRIHISEPTRLSLIS
jgi:hypothetical protein